MQWYLKESSFFPLPHPHHLRSCKGLSGVTCTFFTTPHLILCTSSTETLPHAFLITTNQHFPEFSLLQCWISIPWYLVFRWVSWYFCYLTKAGHLKCELQAPWQVWGQQLHSFCWFWDVTLLHRFWFDMSRVIPHDQRRNYGGIIKGIIMSPPV